MKRNTILPGGIAICLALSGPTWAQLEATYENVPEQNDGGLVEGKQGIVPPIPGPNPTVVPGTSTQDLRTPAAVEANAPAAAPEAMQITPGVANKGDLAPATAQSQNLTQSQGSAAQQSDSEDEEGIEVYTKGPLHEAFATPSEAVAAASPVVSAQPPEVVNEVAPEQMPEGTNIIWIPGYWAFDQELNEYLWISGIWRDVPEGRQWVPGYWTQVQGGWQWVPGMWMDEQVTEISYYPEPPATLERGPSSPAPGDNYFYVPGNWEYASNNYQWRAGYWDQYRDNYVWVNSSYCYTPAGYVYNPGYWDYGLANRGLVYAPVRFGGGWGGAYRPRVLLSSWDNLMVHMFLRPGYNQYVFGNYYGPNYVNLGYRPWYNYGWGGRNNFGRGYAYNPLFNYYNWRYGGNFYGRLDRWNNYYNNNPDWRPRNTWRDQRDFLRLASQRNDIDRAIIRNSALAFDVNNRNNFQGLNLDRQLPVNLRRTDDNVLRNTNQAWRDVLAQRRDFESRGEGGRNNIERREALKLNIPEQLERRFDRQPGNDRPGNGRPGSDRPEGDRPGNDRPGDRGNDDRAQNNQPARDNPPGRPARDLNDLLPNVPGTNDEPGRPGDRPEGDRPGNPRGDNRPGNNDDRPGQPGDRPNRPNGPGNVNPDRPNRPDQPGVNPDRPNQPNQPGQPGNDQPDRPNRPARPDQPGMNPNRPNQPGNDPGQPSGEQPNRPNRPDSPARPDQPGANPDRPGRPDQPGRPNQPGAPGTEPGQPAGEQPNRPNRPDSPVKPNQPGANPDRPGRPNQPGTPGTSPGQPSGEQPNRPNRPDSPGRPNQPGANPGQPAGDGQPGRPNRPSRPDQPGTPGVNPGQPSGGGNPGRPNSPSNPGVNPGTPQPGGQPGGQPGAGDNGGRGGNSGGNGGGRGGAGGGRGGNSSLTPDMGSPSLTPDAGRRPQTGGSDRLDAGRPDRLPANGYGIKTSPDVNGGTSQSGSTLGGTQPGQPGPERLRTADPERGAIGNGGLERRNPDSPRGGLTDRPSNPNRGENVRPQIAPPVGTNPADRSRGSAAPSVPGNLNRNSESRDRVGTVREARPSTPAREARPTPAPAARESRPPAPAREARPTPSPKPSPAPAASSPAPQRQGNSGRGGNSNRGGGREGGGRRGD